MKKIVFIILCTLFFSRWIFTYTYDSVYLNDLFDLSQWRIPLSSRIISDNELYQVSGERIVKGADLFSISPEVPPLGKYLYGWAIVLAQHPYYASILLYGLTILIFYAVALQMLPKRHQLSAVFFLLLSPLFFSQLTQTMVDLPQLLFLLLHVYAIVKLEKSPRRSGLWIVFSGLSLGLFTATKIPLFLPAILLADGWILLRRRQVVLLLPLLATTVLTYMATYLAFFQQGHSILDWLRTQKWMLDFYRSSQIKNIPVMVMLTGLTGWYKGWWQEPWQHVREWSVLWPVTLISLFQKTPQSSVFKYVKLLLFAIIALLAVIPFWPRYFLIVLPFGIILFWKRYGDHRRLVQFVTGLLLIQFVFFIRPQPMATLSFASQDWNKGHYQELFSHLDVQTQQQWDRFAFFQRLKQLDQQLQTTERTLSLSPTWVPPWQNQVNTNATVTLKTAYGQLSYEQPVSLVRQQNRWHLVWDWQLALPQYSAQSQVEVMITPQTQGALITQDDTILSSHNLWPFMIVYPQQVNNSVEDLTQFADLVNGRSVDLENLLFVSGQGLTQVEVGFLPHDYSEILLAEVASHSAVNIEQRKTRVYNSIIRSYQAETASQIFDQVQKLERVHPTIFGQPGVIITVTSTNGEKKLVFEQPVINGETVKLDADAQALFGVDLKLDQIPR